MNNEGERPTEQSKEPESESAQEPATGENSAAPAENIINKPDLDQMTSMALKVITDPVGFYRQMPKTGGLIDPLMFMVVLAVLTGLVSAVFSIFGFGMAGAMAVGLLAVFVVPVFVVIFGFVGSGIAFVIWKVMGSGEEFETAFRCVAYTAAVGPVIMVLGILPYVGTLATALWPMALLAVASIHVHGRSVQTSWAVFGALGVISALVNLGAG